MEEFELEVQSETNFEFEPDNTPYVRFENIEGNVADNQALVRYIDQYGSKIEKIKRNNEILDIYNKEVNIEVPVKVSEVENDAQYDTVPSVNDKINVLGTELRNLIAHIQELIPDQASVENLLADKEFVNSSIATNTGYHKGTYNLVDDLDLPITATHEQIAAKLKQVISESTNNDYVFVIVQDELTSRYDRYKYSDQDESWGFEYTLNNSGYTAAQAAALNSGITATLVALIGTALQPASLNNYYTKTQIDNDHYNKTTIDSKVSTLNTAIGNKVDKVSGKGLSTNDYTTEEKNKLSRLKEIDYTVVATL